MVCQWGMSDRIGPVTFRQGETHPFLGREIAEQKDFSEETAKLIDEEVRQIIQDMEKKARQILESHRDKLETLTENLLKHETLSKQEIDDLLGTEKEEMEDVYEEKKKVAN